MATLRETSSCGIRELHGLSYGSVRETIRTVAKGGRYGHLFFSDNTIIGNGQRLVAEIVKYGLGPVAESVPNRNPHSGNTIIGWVWTPDYVAIERYLSGALKPLGPGVIKAMGVSRSKLRTRARR